MKKRIASLLMAIVMLASLGVGSLAATTEKTLVQGNNTGLSAANFKDLADATKPDGRHWAWDAIDHVVKFGLFNGTSPTTFAPQNSMTRAQFVVVVTRLENTSRSANNKLNVERVPTKTRFTDVPEDMWCAGSVAWAEANGIVEGYSDNTFKPNQAISRAQIAAFVYRYVNNYKKYNLKLVTPAPAQFTDFNTANQVFHSAIDYCRTHGLIQGYGDHSLKPNIAVTRAQVAAILSRIIIIIEESRRGGGGGGGWTPTAAASGFDSTLGAPAWGNLAQYPWGVKYVAVDENGAANPNLSAGANLNDNNGTQDVLLQSGDTAVVDKAKTAPNGFSLTPKAVEGYAVTNVYVYETVPPTSVDDRTNAPVTKLLVEGTDYTLTNGVVKMAADRFTELQRVTVVAEFGVPKTVATKFNFIAIDRWDATTTNTYAEASFTVTNTVTNTETITSGNTAEQTSVMKDVSMLFNVQDGYEIPKPSDDIRVYNTSNINGTNYSPSDYTDSLRMNSLYKLTSEDGKNVISIKGTDLKLSNANPNGLTEVTVVVRVVKSVYGYDIAMDTRPLGDTMPLNPSTSNSFTNEHWLKGSDSLKEALRLLFDDDASGVATLQGILGSDKTIGNNASTVDTFIQGGLAKVVKKLNDGEVKAAIPQSMLESTIAETIAGEINKNVDTYVRDQAAATLTNELTTQYNTLFNSVKTMVQTQNMTVTGNGFVDQSGNDVTPAMWVNNTVNGMTVNANNVKKDDVSVGNLSGVQADVVLGLSGSDISVTPSFSNLGSLAVTVNLTGSYSINTINTGALYVMVSGLAAPYPVSSTGSYNGTAIVISKKDNINVNNYAVPASVLNSVNAANFKFDKDQLQGIVVQVVGGKLDEMKQDLMSKVKAASGTGSAALAVNDSLYTNIISLLTVDKYVEVTENATIKVKTGLNSSDAKNYRAILGQFYDGFWNFHADLFQAYPETSDAAQREQILNAVLDWVLGVGGKSGNAKTSKAAELLAKDRQPTVAQLFNALYDGKTQVSHPKTNKTVDMAQVKKSTPKFNATGLIGTVQNVIGIDFSKQSLPVTFTVYRLNQST